MKILFFITSLSVKSGGPSRSVPMMAKGLSEGGVDVTLMTLFSEDMNTHALDGTSVKLIVLQNGFISDEIGSLVQKEKFDVVQIQSLWSPVYHKLVNICRKLGVPYIITPRGMLEPWSLNQKKWKKKIALLLYQKRDLNHASCIYTTSEMEAKHVRELGIKAPCSVIPNGVETDGYPCRDSKAKVQKQILFLSRIHIKKGIELLIEAWSHLYQQYPDWNVKIVGNGDEGYIKDLRQKINNLELEGCVEILPPVFGQAKVELYQGSSLFVLPSYSENFGMVIAEAMSCGVPIITSEFTPWDFLGDKKAGWCIRLQKDILINTLEEAMNMDSKVLYEMGQNAAGLVRERYDYRNVAQRTIELYDWVLSDNYKPSFIR